VADERLDARQMRLSVPSMRNFLRQTSDPEVGADLQATRPFFWLLILVLIFLYGISLYATPDLRQLDTLLPYTALFFLHIVLHWSMPRLLNQKRRLVAYLLVQLMLVFLLSYISRQQGVVIGLYTSLAGETIGILNDVRRAIAAIAVFLVLLALTYASIWGWVDVPGWLAPAAVIMLFILIYVILFLRQMDARAESQRLLAELQQAHRQLAEYAQQVETLTLEAERQRMARELHDTLAQGLAGLVLQLEALEASLERDDPQKGLAIAGQAKDRARTTLAEARRAIDDLRVSQATPAEAITREVERFQAATGIPCTLEMPARLVVSQPVGEHLLRCIGEGLANVARHAQATQASVEINQDDSRLQVVIRDDGRGFDVEGDVAGGHYGLLGLRERARLAGGELVVKSRPGGGTTLRMMVPAPQDSPLDDPEKGVAS
jgi:NarL family two-component system sensor histidine kinase YdfH